MRRNKLLLATSVALLGFFASTAVLAADIRAVPAKAGQCFACHGSDGLSKAPDAPNLAGQNEMYLVSALKAYRSGARVHEVMSLMAKNLSDAEIDQLAAYFSGIAITVKTP
ncbi:c-type cytochrome [Glaciimonas immobilis]|uniref:Cytochrome c553 n=1 Tax=Glaciimonas immobilis TaxID=728004 RepID=A0A840RVI2_9BURK|nr:cytochrome c [Glaciimonas immobilis]KAF3999995.1 cytochrome c [Glaciimonas immobilis]MBB5200500.1 cytochrome c553 [Glaciimonas immobilis]